MNSNFEIEKLSKGWVYTLNGKQYAETDAKLVLAGTIDSINQTIDDMKSGDKIIVKVSHERK